MRRITWIVVAAALVGLAVAGPGGSAGVTSRKSPRDGTAFVAELMDEKDPGRMTASFSAHIEYRSGGRPLFGPESVPIDEALAWARRRAARVLVQLGPGDPLFSAGVEDPAPDGTWVRWPAGGLKLAARPIATALDGEQQVVGWAIRVTLRPNGGDRETVERAAEAVRTRAVKDATTRRDDSAVIIDGEVDADGMTSAAVATFERMETAMCAVGVPSAALHVTIGHINRAR